jgi:phage-related minor tail protein
MSDLKAQLEISADVGGVESGISKAKNSLRSMTAAAQDAGKEISGALSAAGDGSAESAAKVSAASRSIVESTNKVGAAGSKTGSPLTPAGAGADPAAKKVDQATRSIIASIERLTAAQSVGSKTSSDYFAVLARQRGVDPAALKPYLDALDAANVKTKTAGVSAAQTAAALRSVPAQFTDIATSLAGGQSPLQVLFQQGGQLKDLFGGIGPAARALGGYIGGLINTLTLAGAAAVALAVAYKQGSDEADAFGTALILSGNAAGTTAGRLADSARNVSAVVGTVGKAAEVLAELAAAPNIDASGFDKYAQAAIRLERAVGTATADTVKNFSDLGKAPLSASLKLNETMNFLTRSTYEQIKALTDQGRTAEAASVAQNAYADAIISRGGQVDQQLGLLSRGWRGVKDGAAAAWDAMLNIGRPDTLDEKLAAAQKKLDSLLSKNETFTKDDARRNWSGFDARIAAARSELEALQATKTTTDVAAKAQADAAALVKARALFDDAGKQYLTGLKKLNDEIDQARNTGKAAGASPKEIEVRVQAIRFKFDLAQYEADAGLKIAIGKAAADAEVRQQEVAQRRLEAQRSIGAVSERAAAEASLTIEQARLSSQRELIEQQIDLEKRRPLPRDDQAAATAQKAKLTALRADLAAIKQLQANAPTDTAIKLAGFDIADARESAAEYARLVTQADELTQQHAQSIAHGLAQLITDPLARARAEADLSAQGIEAATKRIADSLRLQIDVLRGKGENGQADILQQRLQQVQATGAGAAAQERGKPGQDAINKFISRDIGTDLSAGFDSASQSLGTFVQTFGKLLTLQQQFNEARAVEGITAEQIARIDQVHIAEQLNGYGALAGAAKGFFKQHTGGYKALEAAEKGFRAFELALAVKNALQKISLIDGVTAATVAGQAEATAAAVASVGPEVAAAAAKGQANAAAAIANQGNGDPYSAFPRIAAMAAIMAALGFATGAIGGSGGSSRPPSNTGTGTVLGDGVAQSASIANSLELLADINTLTMRYSAQMAASLRSIDSGINGLAKLVVQSPGLTTTPAGVQTGFRQNQLGQLAQGDADLIKAYLGPLGSALSKPSADLAKRFGTTTSIDGQGISAQAQRLGEILAKGFTAQYFADVVSKDKFFGATISTSRETRTTAADAELQRQFGLILEKFADTVKSAANPLGAALDDVQSRLDGVVVDIGRIDLQGLTGEQISEKLNAVFGAAGDRIAAAALPGLEQFQAIGEGYLQTVVRVGSAVEAVRTTLESLGQSTSALTGTLADRVQAAMGLIDAFGGQDKLLSITASYLQDYYSAAERTALTTKQLASVFGRLGLTLPKTRDEYRRLVEAQDLSTEAGRSQYATLLQLASAFTEISTAASEAGKTLQDEINRLRGVSGGTSAASAAALQARFATTTAAARAGDAAALDALPEISRALETATAATASSAEDVARMRAYLASSLAATLDLVRQGGAGTALGSAATPTVHTPTTPQRGILTVAPPPGATATSGDADMARQMAALTDRMQTLIDTQRSQGAAIIAATTATASILRNVTQDGDALSIRATS